MNAALDPAVSRFAIRHEEDEEEAEDWRGKVQAFLNLYGFLSQVIPYQDSDLERLYVFLRHLAAKLPRRRSGPAYRFDDEVQLEYYRLQKLSEGSISLEEGEARALDGPTEVGSGLARPQPVPLSQLIDIVNDRFGTDFNQADQLFFDQVVEAAMANDGVRQAAAVNPGDKFELVFKGLLENLFAERMDQNEDIFVRFMNDESFQNVVTGWMSSEAYRRLRSDDGADTERAATGALPPTLRLVDPPAEQRYATCLPLVPLKAAAGAFGDVQHVEDDDFEWVEVESGRRLRRGMFVAQVVGKSMEPTIPDGALVPLSGAGRRHAPGQDGARPDARRYRPGERPALHGQALPEREGGRWRFVASREDQPEPDQPRLRADRLDRHRRWAVSGRGGGRRGAWQRLMEFVAAGGAGSD